MITKSVMHYHAKRAYSMAELLDTAYVIAYDCLNNSADCENALERVKELLFLAQDAASTSADFLSDLISECEADPAPQPAKRQPVARATTVSDRSGLINLKLRSYTLQALAANGIRGIEDLLGLAELDLIKMPGIGRESIKDIKAKLQAAGLSLTEVRQ